MTLPRCDDHPPKRYGMSRSDWATFRQNLRQNKETGCVEWTGATHRGYGRFKGRRTHKAFWEYFNGPVPPRMDLAHACNNKRCVVHVRPKTHQENMQEFTGQTPNTHCPRCGTELTEENIYRPPGKPHERRCRKCRRRA